jgi:predicted flap endonuclease-1-like 5' DNA nuclease
MAKVIDIEGIGKVFAAKLEAAGVPTVEKLLSQGASPKGRATLAEKTGISPKLILKWLNRADLFRIKGINTQYSDLLEAAGVDTVVELAQRNPENLHVKLVEVNEAKKLVRALPTAGDCASWIEHAKSLPRVLTY